MKESLLRFLESALLRFLLLDPESLKRLSALENRYVIVHLKNLSITLHCFFSQNTLKFKHCPITPPDVVIRGNVLTIMRMALTSQDRQSFFAKEIEIEGDLEIADKVIQLFDQLEIDWEEYASKALGDLPAYQLGRLLRGINKFAHKTQTTLTRNLNEYIHEEIPLFPPKEAIRDFFFDVDEIRMDVDRLAAKIDHLKKRLE